MAARCQAVAAAAALAALLVLVLVLLCGTGWPLLIPLLTTAVLAQRCGTVPAREGKRPEDNI